MNASNLTEDNPMKTILMGLSLLCLPVVAPVQAAQTAQMVLGRQPAVPVERRSHPCDTLAQMLTSRCSGV